MWGEVLLERAQVLSLQPLCSCWVMPHSSMPFPGVKLQTRSPEKANGHTGKIQNPLEGKKGKEKKKKGNLAPLVNPEGTRELHLISTTSHPNASHLPRSSFHIIPFLNSGLKTLYKVRQKPGFVNGAHTHRVCAILHLCHRLR